MMTAAPRTNFDVISSLPSPSPYRIQEELRVQIPKGPSPQEFHGSYVAILLAA